MSDIAGTRPGAPRASVTTLSGKEVSFLFDAEAIACIEDAFGSIGAMQKVFGGPDNEVDPQDRKIVRPMLTLTKIGLAYEPAYANERFAAKTMRALFTAVMETLRNDMPEADDKGPKDEPIQTLASPGTASTSTPPSPSIGLEPNSGG